MAINPATGLEDPNYTPPGDEALAGPEVQEATVPEGTVGTQATAPSAIEAPQIDINLSDQSEVLQGGRDQMTDITDRTLEQLEGYEPTRDVGYEGVDVEELKEGAGIEQGSSYITPEATVAGQLETLLDSDSAYMQNAQRRAQEQAASLGLLGSSMAVGATHRAAIEAAMPIAEADAKTYAAAQLKEQETYNQVSLEKAQSDLSAAFREHQYNIDVAKAEANAMFNQISEAAKMQGNMAMETTLAQIKGTWDAETKGALANLEAQLQYQLKEQEISAGEREYASKQASSVMAAAYGTINDLMGNADFMAAYKDNPEGLEKVFDNFINLAKSNVEFIGTSAGLGSEYVGDPLAGIPGYVDLIGDWSADLSGYTPVEN